MREDPSLQSRVKPRPVFSTKTAGLSAGPPYFVSTPKVLLDTFRLGYQNRCVGLMKSRLQPMWHVGTDFSPTANGSHEDWWSAISDAAHHFDS